MVHGILWGIWKERNGRIFDEFNRGYREIVDSIIREVVSWLLITKDFKDLPIQFHVGLDYHDFLESCEEPTTDTNVESSSSGFSKAKL